MHRRDLLTSAALGTALTFLLPALRRMLVFAADGCVEHDARLVEQALRRGRDRGKPVAVFVVPEDAGLRDERAALLGTLIDLGPDRALAVLAMVEVVCAPLVTVQCVVPNAPSESPGRVPLMLLIDPGATTVTSLPSPLHSDEVCPPASAAAVAAPCHARVTRALCARLIAPLRRAVIGSGFARRVRRNAAALGRERATEVRAAAADGGSSLSTALVDDAALLLLESARATGDTDVRGRAIARLAAAGRARLQNHPPPGARWARFDGCVRYAHENDDDLPSGMSCGLGGTPFLAARFLFFLTALDRRT